MSSTAIAIGAQSRARRPNHQTGGALRNPQATHVGWAPAADLGLAEWSAVGRRLGDVARCSQWWVGDWINYGNARFGERYSRASRLTGYDIQSLMNMVYVASRFEISRRRETLSWSHHAALAALDPDSQAYWLSRAAAEKLSVADLRAELRGERHALKSASARGEPAIHDVSSEALVCPHCGGSVPLSH